MTKRMLSLVMVLAMVLSLFAGLTLTTHAADGTYTQVTDASTLADGDTILLAKADSSAYAGAMGTSAFFTSVASQADAIEITLSGDSTGWTFTTSEGTIGTSAAKKLNHTGTGTTTWTISIDSEGLATIASTNTSCGKFLYNNTSPRFLNYTSNVSSSMQLPIIYKKDGGSSTGHTHSWGSWYSNNNGTHSRDCDDPDGDCPDPTQTADCTFGATTVVTAATCSSVGSGTHTCTVCGYTETVEIPVDANAHNWEWDGNEGANGTHGLECADCGATSTEACVDTDDDDVCDICGADIPALTTATGDIVFADLGLENSVAYNDPFTSANGYFTVTFPASGNNGKYYTTGAGIRVYGGGTMTVAATSGTITSIKITCASGYVIVADTSDVGTLTVDGTVGTWTGDASSVSFTRASGSGHWRIQSVSVTVSLASGSHVHSWGAWYTNNDGTHSRDCDDPDGDCPDPTETANCTYGDITVVTPATCSSVGSGTHTCTVCGYTETVEIPIDANAHVWEWDGNEGANGTHGTVCNECGATGTEACVDTDDDDVCDVCGADMPEVLTYTLNDELHDGDKVVIYHPTSGNAISVNASGTKLAAVAVSPSNGELVVEDANVAIFTVEFVDATNFKLIDQNGNYLTSGQTGNSLSLGAESDTLSQWYLSTLGSSKVGIRSTGANYNGNYNQALEYYNGFTTYGWKDSNNAYIFELYTIVNASAHEHTWDAGTETTAATCTAEGVMTYTCTECSETKTEPIPMIAHSDANDDGLCDACGGTIYTLATTLNEGDSVVIYHPVSKTALTGTATSNNRLVAEAVNVLGGLAVTSSSDIAVLTVAYLEGSTTDFYLKSGDSYLTTGETGNSLTLEAEATNYSVWTLDTSSGSALIVNANAAYTSGENTYPIAVEYYGGNFNGYSWKNNGDTAFYMELYTIPAAAADTAITVKGASLSLGSSDPNGDIQVNFYVELPAGSTAAAAVMTCNGTETMQLFEDLTAVGSGDYAGCYKLSCAVPMKSFKDNVVLKVYEEDLETALPLSDGVDTYDDGYIYTVQTYLDSPASQSATGDLKNVLDSLDYLGRAAEAQFNHNSDTTEYAEAKSYIEANFAGENADYVDGVNVDVSAEQQTLGNAKFYGASLLLKDKVTLRYFFLFNDGEDGSAYTVYVDGVAAGGLTRRLNNNIGTKYWYYDLTGIAAKDLGTAKTVEIRLTGEDNTKITVTGVSALTYATQVIDDGTPEALVYLCKALYVYQAAAAAYFN